jgi:hypothetical protein
MSKGKPRPQSDPNLARLLKQFLGTFLATVRSLSAEDREELAFQLVKATDVDAPEPLASFGRALSVAVLAERTFARGLYQAGSDIRRETRRRRSRKPDAAKAAEIERLVAEGWTQPAIARKLCMSVDAVRGRLKRARKAPPPP